MYILFKLKLVSRFNNNLYMSERCFIFAPVQPTHFCFAIYALVKVANMYAVQVPGQHTNLTRDKDDSTMLNGISNACNKKPSTILWLPKEIIFNRLIILM